MSSRRVAAQGLNCEARCLGVCVCVCVCVWRFSKGRKSELVDLRPEGPGAKFSKPLRASEVDFHISLYSRLWLVCSTHFKRGRYLGNWTLLPFFLFAICVE